MPPDLINEKSFLPHPVLVVGDIMLDRYWFGEVERISPEAPVPVLKVERIEERLGGAGNVARNITALKGACSLIGALGADEAASAIKRLTTEAGISDASLTDPDYSTIVKLRMIGRQQQLLRADFEKKPNDRFMSQRNAQTGKHLPGCGAMVLSDYGKGMLGELQSLISIARKHQSPVRPQHTAVLIDPKGDDWNTYRGATVVTPNRAELSAVIGRWKSEADLAQRVEALMDDLQLEALLLTRSDEGMTLFDQLGRLDVPALAREVYDVTGAGDTVIAVLAMALASGHNLRQGVVLANKAAGIVVGKLGTAVCTREALFAP
jgi:rfaE bifunctional protein kinase chain/domain